MENGITNDEGKAIGEFIGAIDELWTHMHDDHNLLLLESELYEIRQICNKELVKLLAEILEHLEKGMSNSVANDMMKIRDLMK